MRIEVVYALPLAQDVSNIELPEGSTAGEAIKSCGLLERHPEIDLQVQPVGVWGRRCQFDTVLRDGDRVEVYRRLVADPKESRRRRAAKGGGGP